MDLLLLRKFVKATVKEKETEKEGFGGAPPEGNDTLPGMEILLYAVLLCTFGSLAAYLSWGANTLIGWNTVCRVLFALLSFAFSLTFLVVYVCNRLDMVKYIKRAAL